MTKRKPKRKITLLEAQRRRLEALDRWFQFIKGELLVSPEDFADTLLFPTYWSLGGHGYSSAGSPMSAEEVEGVKQLIIDGFKRLVEEGALFLSLRDLEITITPHGTTYKGTPHTLSQLGIAQLLRTEEWRIGRCAWCEQLFLKKKRGYYCSLRCSQRMRTKRVRDPRWREDEKKAKRLGFTIGELKTAEELSCPKCGAKNLTPRKQLVVGCRKCGELFARNTPHTKQAEGIDTGTRGLRSVQVQSKSRNSG